MTNMDVRRRPTLRRRESSMALTSELVSLSLRVEADPGPEPHPTPLTKAELEIVAERLLHESGVGPLWIFAYGSLIWKQHFVAVESLRGVARGWHRSFCLEMTRWRGTSKQPGLMMALDQGGRCNGILFRLSNDERLVQVRQLLRREVKSLEDAATVRWIPVETAQGSVRALVFWAGPKGMRVFRKLPLETVAGVLARACGPGGSGAEYLYLTVKHLEERGIRDRNLWRLQKLVADELTVMHGLNGETAIATENVQA